MSVIVKNISIGLTTRCNFSGQIACGFCFRSTCQNEIPNIDIDIKIAKSTFTKNLFNNLNYLTICGGMGDFMFYPKIFEFVKHLSKNSNDLKVLMDTNGSSNSLSWWRDLSNNLKDINHEVRFGIDGLKDTHLIYRRESDFDKVIKNAKHFIDCGGRAVWKFVVFKHNEHQIEEASNLAKTLGFHNFLLVMSCYYNEIFEESLDYIKPKYNKVVCKSLRNNSISIDADGEVMPCIHYKPIKNFLNNQGIYWNDVRLMLKYTKCKRKLNIYTSTIDEAVKSEFFSYIYENYKSIENCKFNCGESGRREDLIIIRRDNFNE